MATAVLQDAISALKAGKRAEAQRLLQEIIRANPTNEKAWLWYVDTLLSDAERIQALKWCLKFNPDSDSAQRGLNALSGTAETANSIPQFPQEATQTAKTNTKPVDDNHQAGRELLSNFFARERWEDRELYWHWDGALFCEDCGEKLKYCTACGAYFCVECQLARRCILCGEQATVESEKDEFRHNGFSIIRY
jgi:hypothetical protein